MAKEKWLIDPGELDEFQREIRELSINDSYVIKGCAGSGKTILALYRANDIRIEALAEDARLKQVLRWWFLPKHLGHLLSPVSANWVSISNK